MGCTRAQLELIQRDRLRSPLPEILWSSEYSTTHELLTGQTLLNYYVRLDNKTLDRIKKLVENAALKVGRWISRKASRY